MNIRRTILALVAAVTPHWAVASVQFEFPGVPILAAEQISPMASYGLPISTFLEGKIEKLSSTGRLEQRAWKIRAPSVTTMQVLDPLRDQLVAAGFNILFECEARNCGGFDFRFGTEVIAEPEMHVDLGDFQFLSAEKPTPDGPERISLLVSRSTEFAYVQITRIGDGNGQPLGIVKSTKATATAPASAPVAAAPSAVLPASLTQLEAEGAYVLDDLAFDTGSAQLGAGDYPSLAALADYLKANPARRVVLVGHSDADGSLEANVALSRKRAESVAAYLVGTFGVAAGQVSADGVGFLAPRASNQTDVGRTQNRRVEVILATSD